MSEAHAGATAIEVCRRHGISEGTFYRWKAKYGGMPVSHVKRLKDLQLENGRLKRLLAEVHLGNAALKDLLSKNLLTPAARRWGVSERCACGLVGVAQSVARYRPQARDNAAVRVRMRELAGHYRRYG